MKLLGLLETVGIFEVKNQSDNRDILGTLGNSRRNDVQVYNRLLLTLTFSFDFVFVGSRFMPNFLDC